MSDRARLHRDIVANARVRRVQVRGNRGGCRTTKMWALVKQPHIHVARLRAQHPCRKWADRAGLERTLAWNAMRSRCDFRPISSGAAAESTTYGVMINSSTYVEVWLVVAQIRSGLPPCRDAVRRVSSSAWCTLRCGHCRCQSLASSPAPSSLPVD
jgi:hypothetical protein